MQKIRIIAMGKLTEAPFRAAAEEYAKRISRFYSLALTELKPEPLPLSPSPAEIAKALYREADRILEDLFRDVRKTEAACLAVLDEAFRMIAASSGTRTSTINSRRALAVAGT